jgi:multiple sugar transport system ATP-binding protein
VAIARALAKEPDILLLDEPLSNLDAKLRVEMREEIRRIQRDTKVTTLFVTHDQEEASSIADHVILLEAGVLQQQGAPRELYDNPVNAFVADFFGAPPINHLRGTIVPNGILLNNSEKAVPFSPPRPLPAGTPVILAVRAEAVRTESSAPVFEGLVVERYSLGKDELARFDVFGQTLRGYVNGDTEFSPGDKLPIAFGKKGVFCFNANTGERYL